MWTEVCHAGSQPCLLIADSNYTILGQYDCRCCNILGVRSFWDLLLWFAFLFCLTGIADTLGGDTILNASCFSAAARQYTIIIISRQGGARGQLKGLDIRGVLYKVKIRQ